jgi:molecular chaperone GrpE
MGEEQDGAPEAQAGGAPGAEATSLEERLAAAESELAESKDRLLRALAETENVRRRAQREREDAARFGASNLAKDLVNVADNLRRALASVPEAQVKDDLTRTLLQGVDATERELLAAFERHGIRRIDPMGERFDHNFHQAIMEIENSGEPGGTVVQVLQPGYAMHDRLLRPAMVAVAKGERPPGATPVDETV